MARPILRKLLLYVALPLTAVLFAAIGFVYFVGMGITGERHLRGEIAAGPLPGASVEARQSRQRDAVTEMGGSADEPDQILFGDLHVHTTYSADAFVFSLPLMQGEGAHPPADACDFARFCAELDFWSVNDHAEHLTPWQWQETKESIRECNAAAGDPADPDLVSFLGWEWTQSAPEELGTDRTHYGHKNVVLLDTGEDRVPTRPIGAGRGSLFPTDLTGPAGWALVRSLISLGDLPGNLQPYLDFSRYTRDVAGTPACAEDVPVRDLPADCLEGADTPDILFRKLDDWGFPSLVIPHGTSWGIHAPTRADLADQLEPGMHDDARQRLFESYSGHGSSEVWRGWQDVELDAEGRARCAAPTAGYEPCCWRAGEIIRGRCGDAAADVCEERVENARQWFVDAGPGPRAFGVVSGTHPNDWLECGQLSNAFLPTLNYRTKMSAQYGLARRPASAGEGRDGAFRYGLIGSSDNHKARAGPGYKELGRKSFGDAYGLREDWLGFLRPEPKPASPEPLPPSSLPEAIPFADPGSERNASYYYTSGLVAVHAASRRREAIFDALSLRRAYGTSGPRILLWFSVEDAAGGRVQMGGEATHTGVPRFDARAMGSFEQRPGCPSHTLERLSPERLEKLCLGECYNPGDRRIPIERIEVVRIRPQVRPDEPLEELIEDPWRTFDCPALGAGCAVSFEDPDYDPSREHVYYVRALQAPTPAVNGDPMRCERDEAGRCTKARLCAASGPEYDPGDECLAEVQERAWSSPIFVTGAGGF